MDIKEFNVLTFDKSAKYGFQMKPQIICNDGFKMSVQGSSGRYCSPREVSDIYFKMEIGFPSEKETLIMPYIDGGEDGDPTNSVYGYVPCDIIDAVILKHGGINQKETFKK